MPKLIVSIDGVVVKEAQITKDRTTIGRRPYNDVVIDSLAISGEHALLTYAGDTVTLEDLKSTNGTYVNGKAIKRQALMHDDVIEVGKYKIRFVFPPSAGIQNPPVAGPTGAEPSILGNLTSLSAPLPARGPRVRVLTGSAAGRELELTKIVTTVGKPRISVASITRKAHGFDLACVDGDQPPRINGQTVSQEPVTLKHGDEIQLAGTRMQFIAD